MIWSLIYISPLQTTRCFACIQAGKMSIFKSLKIRENPLLVLFLFTGPIILTKGMIWNNVQLSKKNLNACNVGHSTADIYISKVWKTKNLLKCNISRKIFVDKFLVVDLHRFYIWYINTFCIQIILTKIYTFKNP